MTPLVPGGRADDPAITWAGRTIRYREFREMVARAPTGWPLDVSGLAVPLVLACAFAAARAGTSVLVRDPAAVPDDLGGLPAGTWLVAATSGSTGRPRAVCRTAESWAASVAPLAELAGLSPDDRVALTGSLHATLHLHAALHTLAIGAELTDDVSRASAVHAVPAVLTGLLDSVVPERRLRSVVVAGAALPDGLAARATRLGLAVTEYYGAAELSFVAARRLPDPVLRPFPGVAVRLGPGGVLWARSPYLALGYAGSRPGPLRIDGDGFATVGDVASAVTSDHLMGGLVIRGRGESAVTTGGFTVLVEDVEAVLRTIAGVREVAVVGLPHPRLGEILTAVLELAPGIDVADVRAAARRALSGASLPRRYLVVDALPRTGGGKIARGALRQSVLATLS